MDLTARSTSILPITPLAINNCVFGFDSSDFDPDDNTSLTPLLRRLTATPKLLTPKSFLLTAATSPATAAIARAQAVTPTIINGRLAPPQMPQQCSNSPQRRGFRRLPSPCTTAGSIPIRVEVPTQHNLGAESKSNRCRNNSSSKSNSTANNLAARRRCRQLRLQELQRRYAVPFEVHAVAKPLSPRVGYLLRRAGMIRYRSLFQMEEVDFVVFRTLSERDLQTLGIADANDREEIFKAVLLADVLILELV
ncbi:uncharacterized protein LOC128862079 [Anastrepha ludens]|uniref:uncharacterized protein LOC128862079 n=1 Tax=Anastrepha ludens TaxID=28586 RepID=UPI0023B15A51|nr:uncharacterized protein LOC128862079 [Anastrepha ludens]